MSQQPRDLRHAETPELDAMVSELQDYYQIREDQGLHTAVIWAYTRILMLLKFQKNQPIEHMERRVEALEHVVEEQEQSA